MIGYYHPWKQDYRDKPPGTVETMPDFVRFKRRWQNMVAGFRGTPIVAIRIHTDGKFLALEKIPNAQQNWLHVFCSLDAGATWKDVTSNLPGDIREAMFLRDFQHPGLVALQVRTGKEQWEWQKLPDEQIFQADPANFNWIYSMSRSYSDDRGMDSMIRNPQFWLTHGWQFGSSAPYQQIIQPTLATYFDPAFKDWGDPDTQGWNTMSFHMVLEKTAYTFSKDAPKIIPVKIEYLAENPAAKLADSKDVTGYWRVGMVSYGKAPGFDPYQMETGGKKGGRWFNESTTWVSVDPLHPSGRDIDIALLHDFSKPVFTASCSTMRTRTSVGSPVIDVTITE